MADTDSPFDDFDDFDSEGTSPQPRSDDDPFDPFGDDDPDGTFGGADDAADTFDDDFDTSFADQAEEAPQAPEPPRPSIAHADSETGRPSIIRVEKPEEPAEAVTYDNEAFDDVSPEVIPFIAPTAEEVFTAGNSRKESSRPAPQVDSRAQRKAQQQAKKAAEEYERQRDRERERTAQSESRRQKQLDAAEAKRRRKEEQEEQRRQQKEEKEARRRQQREERGQKRRERPAGHPRSEGKGSGGATSRKDLIPVLAAVLGLVIVAGAGVALFRGGGDSSPELPDTSATAAGVTSPQDSAPSEPAAPANTPEAKLLQVVNSRCIGGAGNETVTNDPGSASSAIGAIQGFNYAYFTEKDAELAAEYLDRSMYNSISSLQEGIDSDQNGDAYCLHIEPINRTTYSVGVVEFVEPETADGDVLSWRTDQQITLERKGDEWVIVKQAIES